MSTKLGLIELIESSHLINAIRFLHEKGVVTLIITPLKATQIAELTNTDESKLETILWYVSERTDFIYRMKNDHYCLNDKYKSYRNSGFWIDQYIGAYGISHIEIDNMLKKGSIKNRYINDNYHALAYDRLDNIGMPFLFEMIKCMNVSTVMELGCGNGILLSMLAENNRAFFGVGIESNPFMHKKAEERMQKKGLSKQLVFLNGSAEYPEKFPEIITRTTELIVAASLVNEFFSDSRNRIENWLIKMKKVFSGKTLMIADYYGRMQKDKFENNSEVLLHDWIQFISGQGIPPADRLFWNKIYLKVGCKLIDVVESRESKIPYFVHLISL